jgi:hypothetical protein
LSDVLGDRLKMLYRKNVHLSSHEVKMVDVETLAKVMQADHEWLSLHFDEMIDQYAGKVIAIQNQQIVGVGETWDEVGRPFQESGQEILPLIIDIPHPGDWDNLWI